VTVALADERNRVPPGRCLAQRGWKDLVPREARAGLAKAMKHLAAQHKRAMAALAETDRQGWSPRTVRVRWMPTLTILCQRSAHPAAVPALGEKATAVGAPPEHDEWAQALRQVLDPQRLPTHADVARVFPWLDPDAPLRTFDAGLVWAEDLGRLDVRPSYTTPLPWIYWTTNPYFKVRTRRAVRRHFTRC